LTSRRSNQPVAPLPLPSTFACVVIIVHIVRLLST
jgi:hypothetical protein